MPYPCFWLEPTTRVHRYLRRFVYSDSRTDEKCPAHEWGSHDAQVQIEDGEGQFSDDGYLNVEEPNITRHNDSRWPTHCACGYAFTEDDEWHLFDELIYRRPDTGEEMTLDSAAPGAMWDAWWMSSQGPDGICLTVKTPGGEWRVDDRANNCGMPDDKWSTPGHHYCWVRHGDPKQMPSTLMVDKNGYTCNAGAGSIQAGSYHGFLQGGSLT